MTNEEAKTILDRFNAWRKGWGDDFPYEAKQISAAIDVAISALSAPLPHQDGASAEDVLIKFVGHKSIGTDTFASVFWSDALCAMRLFASQEVAKIVVANDREIANMSDSIGYHKNTIQRMAIAINEKEAMHQFAQSETAKVVAEKDLTIKEREEECMSLSYDLEKMTNAWTVSHKTAVRRREKIDVLQSELSTANAHRTRLIESVKKWGGAWRKCRAELKEAKKEIERLKEFEFMYNGLNK